MVDNITIVMYALIPILGAVAVWFALRWHDTKIMFGDLSVRYVKLFRDYSNAQAEASMANWYAKRALEAEKKLQLVDEYGNDQYDSAQSRGAKESCLYQTFEQWIKENKGGDA